MAYHSLSNTVSVHMGTKGKIKVGQQTAFNDHNNEPEKRAAHNKNVNPELTKYNINLIFDGMGNIDTRDISDTQKFEEAFSMRLSKRKKKDSMGRKIKLNGKNVARETLWYPPQNIFEGLDTIEERQEVLQEYIDDMLPFWRNTFGSENIIEVSGHLDENAEIEGRPHIHLLTMNILQKEQEWESKKSIKRKNGTKEKVVSKHSEGDIYECTWFGGKSKLKEIKDNYRKHCNNCGYDVKLEDMTEEERLMTGATFSAEGLKAFQEMMDEREAIDDEREELNKKKKLQYEKAVDIEAKKNRLEKREKDVDKKVFVIQQKEKRISTKERDLESKIKEVEKDLHTCLQALNLLQGDSSEMRFIKQIGQEQRYRNWIKSGAKDLSKRTETVNNMLRPIIKRYLKDLVNDFQYDQHQR